MVLLDFRRLLLKVSITQRKLDICACSVVKDLGHLEAACSTSVSDIRERLESILLSPSKNMCTTHPELKEDFVEWLQSARHMTLSMFSMSAFQASHLAQAVNEVNRMLSWTPSPEEVCTEDIPPETRCTIWLSSTSNLMYSGLRDVFVYLTKNSLINVFVTSSGAIEADLIRCLAPVYIKTGSISVTELSQKGYTTVGNIIIPNSNYTLLFEWFKPIFDECLDLQRRHKIEWTPSKLIRCLGEKINNKTSVLYWCYKNDIPIFCPGITDGILGTFMFMLMPLDGPKLVLDIVKDIRLINDIALRSKKSGIIILGGGVSKHHVCNANLMRNGADFAVFINTAQEFDGSDSGASPDEAISWGKIRCCACPVKLCCDASVVFPLLVSLTFVKHNEDLVTTP